MEFKNIVVAGGGVLGSQIAYQTAFKGFNVKFWLRSAGSIERTQPKVETLHQRYLDDLEACKAMVGQPNARMPRGLVDNPQTITIEEIDALKVRADEAFKSILYTTDIAEAVKDADLVIESVAEIPSAKAEFYSNMAPHLPEHTVIVTNSSTLLPSSFAEYTGRPEMFLALHFANTIWRNNTAEVMGHATTRKDIFEEIVKFAGQIGMVALRVNKEQPGYILNSLLVPFLDAAETLWVNEVSDPETIDLTWMLGTGAPIGPFRILDIVGLETAYNIVKMKADAIGDPNSLSQRICDKLQAMIEQGKTGIAKGEGFYKYK